MKHRVVTMLLALFVFTFSLVLAFHINSQADEPGQCDCCQDGDLQGTWKFMGEGYICSCGGCGPYFYNPNNCPLHCRAGT
jgi:hypothetical protein